MDAIAVQAPIRQNTPRLDVGVSTSRSSARGVVGCATAAAMSRGDRAAIESFYTASFPIAFAVARSATRRDESFCLDVVHDAMVRLLRGVKASLTDEQLDLYLKRCVVTASIDLMRSESRRTARARSLASPPTPADESDGDRIATLRAALNQLDDLDRSLLSSRFAHGHTLKAAGEAHGLSGPAAHGRLRRALERVRALMKEGNQ